MATISSGTSEEDLKEGVKEELMIDSTGQTCHSLLPQDVLCDSCMDGPSKALKSCLTCLVSYCELHLRPHLEKVKFQNHRLVEPLHDIDCQTCDAHCLPFERFCLMDNCCLCLDCAKEAHEGHTTASVGEARAKIETELQQKHSEISQSVSATEKAIAKLQSNNDIIKFSVQEVCAVIEQQFSRLQTAVQEAKKGAMAVLEGEQKQAFRQAEGIQAHLEQRKVELMKILAQMSKLPKAKTDIDFLQEYSEWKKREADVSLPIVYVNQMEHLSSYAQIVTDATQELCDLMISSYSEKMNLICKSGSKMPESQPSPLPDPQTREDFLKYARSLTFDPDTIHKFLRVTEDNRKLTNTSPWQHSYSDHPSRFEYWRQAMTSESLYLGRHYIEAELSGEGAHVGVTYKSIDRKGEESTSSITGNDHSWCLGRNSRGFSVWHAAVETPLEVTDIPMIGLYADFHKGSVSFYNVTDTMTLLHSFKVDFLEPLYVVAWLKKKDNIISLLIAK